MTNSQLTTKPTNAESNARNRWNGEGLTLSCLAPLMPSSWLKLDPAAGALSGAFPFAFAAQPTNQSTHQRGRTTENANTNSSSHRRNRAAALQTRGHVPSLASVSAARTTGNGRLPANGASMQRSKSCPGRAMLHMPERDAWRGGGLYLYG